MRNRYDRGFIVLIAFCLALSGCTGTQIATPTSTATIPPTTAPKPTALVTPIPLPALTLHPGDFYFSVDGQPGLIFSRNLAGYEQMDYETLLDWTQAGGSKFVRVQLDSLGMGYSNTGEVDEAWAKEWENIFEKAASNGIYVMPVFGVWCDWNDGEGYSTWKSNPLNKLNGGPAKTPAELFISDSSTSILWLGWMKTLIERWQGQKNILAWEIFSEVNMAPGTTESNAIEFVNSAALVIHNADTFHRPVTASLADFGNWSGFYRSDSIDFINIHPYPVSGKLDATLIDEVRSMLAKYRKPVLIGESGLSFLTPDTNPPTLTTADRAGIGIKHAIWAAVVSGAMNGRAFWWEDGYGIYFPDLGMPWMQKYKKVELPAVNFVRDVDFSGFQPLTSTSSSEVGGAVVGNKSMVLGWFRDAASEPPGWTVQTIPAGTTVTLTIPGNAANWKIDFYDTSTGTDIVSSTTATRKGNKVTITLPDFTDDIAFKMMAGAETSVITPEVAGNTNVIAGTWSGSISNNAGTFSTPLKLSIQPDCEAGNICGTFTAPQLPCSGDLFLNEIAAAHFIFIEQHASGAASCISGGYEYLQLLEDGTLSYAFSSQSTGDSSTGILHRP
jgi:hypothetical protein